MSAETDKILSDFGSEVNGTTNEIAADIDALIANQGASADQLRTALAPISEQLKAVAAKYPVVVEPPPPPPEGRRR